MIRPHSLLTDHRTAAIFASIPRSKRVIDIGAGIRPCPLVCDEYVAIEPFEGYVNELRRWHPNNMEVRIIQCDARLIESFEREDTTVLALDVVEHLERVPGLELLELLETFAHAVVFTPYGFVKQEGDAWGMKGDIWQRHRSGWLPEDFGKAWEVYWWRDWNPRKHIGAILAIH